MYVVFKFWRFSDPLNPRVDVGSLLPSGVRADPQGSRDRVNRRTSGETASNNQQEGFASQIIYIFVILASKLSVLSLYLRLSLGGSHRIASWSLVALSCLWALVSVILIAIPCNPAQTYIDAGNCTNRVSQLHHMVKGAFASSLEHTPILMHHRSGQNGSA